MDKAEAVLTVKDPSIPLDGQKEREGEGILPCLVIHGEKEQGK